MLKRIAFALALLIAACPAVAFAQAFPSNDMIQSILNKRSAQLSNAAIIVGIIDHGKTSILKAGSTGTGSPLNENTIFQVGSVTKTFTATMLAVLVESGQLSPDEPVSKTLGVAVPSRDGKQITLLDLATQTSGLPRLPTNLQPANPADPYADYSAENLRAFLASYTLPRDPGSLYEYSNLGFGLLGYALSRQQKTTYAALLARLVTGPLGMTHTMAGIPQNDPVFAAGHGPDGNVVPAWHLGILQGAGAIASSVTDMLKYLRANMGDGPLASVTEFAQQPRRSTPLGMIGFAWMHGPTGITWHNGATAGYTSFIGITKDRTRGVVLLSNSGFASDDIALHLLAPNVPVRDLPNVSLSPATLEEYAGDYSLAPGATLSVTVKGAQLIAQLTGQPAVAIYASSKDHFYYRVVDAQITFNRDTSGKVIGLTLHQYGRDIPAAKT